MKYWHVILLCCVGCEWDANVAPQKPTINASEVLTTQIDGTWLPYDRVTRQVDESSPITIQKDASSNRYDISWPNLKHFTVSVSTMRLKANPDYALADFEIAATNSDDKTFRLAFIHVQDDSLCVWWIRAKRLEKVAEDHDLKIRFETCIPSGTSVECDSEELLKVLLSNPRDVVGEPEVLTKQQAK